MSLMIYDNSRHHGTILASRVRPSGVHPNGLVDVSGWPCPRCGQDVQNHGAHLIRNAPCQDCRWFLRDEYGDETQYDKRQKPRPEPPVFESWPAEVELTSVGFWLTVGGVDLLDLYVGEWES